MQDQQLVDAIPSFSDAALPEVQAAARIAGAHDFVMDLPNGYDTGLGTVSSKLSVGQNSVFLLLAGC
jgi:ATP-binding cassette, subfamily B, bacterial IrtA/YbtP